MTLTDSQLQMFFDRGYVVLKDCLDKDLAQRWIDDAYARLGYRADDPTTWTKGILWMDHQSQLPVEQVAPKAWAAILENSIGN